MKKIFILLLVFIFYHNSCFSESCFCFDFGEIEFKGEFSQTVDFNSTMEILDFSIVNDVTGLYVSFCPLKLEFPISSIKNKNNDKGLSFIPELFTILNTNIGWMRMLSEEILFEVFIGCSTLNPLDIRYISFKAGTELSWSIGLGNTDEFLYKGLAKICSLETGLYISNQDKQKIKLYIAFDVNFMILSGLTK